MKSAPKAPAAPDPAATAAAQAAANKETAITQARLNNFNQITPFGSLTYREDAGPDGVPRFTAIQTLSDAEQRNLDQTNAAQDLYGQAALSQLGAVRDKLATPLSLDNPAVEGRLLELGRSRLDPMLNERRAAMDTSLRNQGLLPGTEGYDRAMRGITQGENDAYTQLLLGGRGQAIQELLTERAQPLNEASALLTGQQVQQPSFVNTTQTNVAPTDYLGAVGMQQQALQNAFNTKNQNYQSQLSGLYSMGSAALGGWARGAGGK